MDHKKKLSFMLERDLLARLESIKARTGLSYSEQIRRAIQMWLASREWPVRREPGRRGFSND